MYGLKSCECPDMSNRHQCLLCQARDSQQIQADMFDYAQIVDSLVQDINTAPSEPSMSQAELQAARVILASGIAQCVCSRASCHLFLSSTFRICNSTRPYSVPLGHQESIVSFLQTRRDKEQHTAPDEKANLKAPKQARHEAKDS